MQAITVIGDIVHSKEIARREAFQRKLATTLGALGSGKGSGLASRYTITLGDEFQAVYRSAGSLWADLLAVLVAIHPIEVRFGIGVGEITTKLNPRQALGMDGPAFHRARAALTVLKGNEGRFRVVGKRAEDWALANHALAFIAHHLAGWSKNRLEVLAALLAGRSVSEFEGELPISKVAIYKNINAAALADVAAILAEIARALDVALHAE